MGTCGSETQPAQHPGTPQGFRCVFPCVSPAGDMSAGRGRSGLVGIGRGTLVAAVSPVGKSKYVRANLGDRLNRGGFVRGRGASAGASDSCQAFPGLHAGFPASLQSEIWSFHCFPLAWDTDAAKTRLKTLPPLLTRPRSWSGSPPLPMSQARTPLSVLLGNGIHRPQGQEDGILRPSSSSHTLCGPG